MYALCTVQWEINKEIKPQFYSVNNFGVCS